MKVLKAPNENTVIRNTSVGEVSFVEGVATEFTDEQAEFFCEEIPGYTLVDIPTEEEAAKAALAAKPKATEPADEEESSDPDKDDDSGGGDQDDDDSKSGENDQNPPADDSGKPEEASDNESGDGEGQSVPPVKDDKIYGNLRGLAGIDVSLINFATGEPIATTVTDENGDWEFADPGEGDFNVNFFGEGVETEDEIVSAIVGTPYYGGTPSTSEGAEGATAEEIEASNVSTGEEATAPASGQPGEGEGQSVSPSEETTEGTEGKAGGESGDGSGDDGKPADSEEGGESSQNAPDGAQTPPADVSPNGGTETPPESETTDKVAQKAETVVLPTTQTDLSDVQQFCRDNNLSDKGNKKKLLKRIYADPRFKK